MNELPHLAVIRDKIPLRFNVFRARKSESRLRFVNERVKSALYFLKEKLILCTEFISSIHFLDKRVNVLLISWITKHKIDQACREMQFRSPFIVSLYSIPMYCILHISTFCTRLYSMTNDKYSGKCRSF